MKIEEKCWKMEMKLDATRLLKYFVYMYIGVSPKKRKNIQLSSSSHPTYVTS